MKDKGKAARRIAERAVEKVGGKKVKGKYNMAPAVRKEAKKRGEK